LCYLRFLTRSARQKSLFSQGDNALGGVKSMKNIGEIKDGLVGKYRSKVRERAITQAKARIALSERNFEDFSEDDLEIIVQDEEGKVTRGMKQSAVVALLITLGLA
jgi:hypothetical protein